MVQRHFLRLVPGLLWLVLWGLTAGPSQGQSSNGKLSFSRQDFLSGPTSPLPGQAKYVQADLVADVRSIAPGHPFRLGVRFRLDPGWHIYSRDSGDAGKPTAIHWELPAGFKAGPLQWPKPERLETGDLVTYVYQHEVILFTTVTPPVALPPGSKPFKFSAATDWIACSQNCVPGKASLELSLPAGRGDASNAAKDISRYAAHVLADQPSSKKDVPKKLQNPDPATTQTAQITPALQAPGGNASPPQTFAAIHLPKYHGSLWSAILFAFLGGAILNVMPCVLPILSLKALSLVRHSGQAQSRVLKLGIIFTLGMLVSFALLAAVVIGLQITGSHAGWGFQFQQPRFVILMAAVILAFSLSLFGVYTIELPWAALNNLDALSRREGALGAFFNGALTTAMGASCTAPLLGPTLAFALTQPPWFVLIIFLTIGLGMATPYVLLSASPSLRRLMPRPGRWMEGVKIAMGGLLILYVLWLLWVLRSQVGTDGVLWTMAFLASVAAACLVYGLGHRPGSGRRRRAVAWLFSIFLVTTSFFAFPERYLLHIQQVRLGGNQPAQTVASDSRDTVWEPFNIERVEKAVTSGRTVFVDFTAKWCTTCMINENATLNSGRVREAFRRHQVLTFKADWTSWDSTIGRVLEQFGQSGVPLYVIFPAGRLDKPIILPTILTPGLIEQALNETSSI